jgi:ferredoxin-NADP reductase
MAPVGSRVAWREAHLVDRRYETAAAATLVLGVRGWPGHLPGQHVDVRLTAADGYSTQRSYSLAGPDHGARIELTVQMIMDGEVSPFLVQDLAIGDPIELRGPVGGWFVWHPEDARPVLLVAGGSGVVPLMAMVRARHAAGNPAPFHLVYSVRTPDEVYYAAELGRLARHDAGLQVTLVHTRRASQHSTRPARRLDAAEVAELAWPAEQEPVNFVCGPTGFVDDVSEALVTSGHRDDLVRTERFGGMDERQDQT